MHHAYRHAYELLIHRGVTGGQVIGLIFHDVMAEVKAAGFDFAAMEETTASRKPAWHARLLLAVDNALVLFRPEVRTRLQAVVDGGGEGPAAAVASAPAAAAVAAAPAPAAAAAAAPAPAAVAAAAAPAPAAAAVAAAPAPAAAAAAAVAAAADGMGGVDALVHELRMLQQQQQQQGRVLEMLIRQQQQQQQPPLQMSADAEARLRAHLQG